MPDDNHLLKKALQFERLVVVLVVFLLPPEPLHTPDFVDYFDFETDLAEFLPSPAFLQLFKNLVVLLCIL